MEFWCKVTSFSEIVCCLVMKPMTMTVMKTITVAKTIAKTKPLKNVWHKIQDSFSASLQFIWNLDSGNPWDPYVNC